MQKGLVNEEAAKRAETAGLQVVIDRCMMGNLPAIVRRIPFLDW
jgi:predicted CoA-binding protein